jgi:hypothetical protein
MVKAITRFDDNPPETSGNAREHRNLRIGLHKESVQPWETEANITSLTENHDVPFETSLRITSWSPGRTHKTWKVQILEVWQQRWQQPGRHQTVTDKPVPTYGGVRSACLCSLCGRGGTGRSIPLLTLNHLVQVRILVRQLPKIQAKELSRVGGVGAIHGSYRVCTLPPPCRSRDRPLGGPGVTHRELELVECSGVHLDRVAGAFGRHVAAVLDPHGIQEVLV